MSDTEPRAEFKVRQEKHKRLPWIVRQGHLHLVQNENKPYTMNAVGQATKSGDEEMMRKQMPDAPS